VLSCDAKGTKEDTNNAMRRWASARQRMVVNPVLIISYESLRMYAPILAQTPIGLMLCDEGHRLKNSGMIYIAKGCLTLPGYKANTSFDTLN